MKNFFYNILFVSVLCCGFSVYAQENESEWMTCLETAGWSGMFMGWDCLEVRNDDIKGIQHENDRMIIYLSHQRRFVCLYENWVNGKVCSTPHNE